MDDLFRLPSAVKHEPAIEDWLRAQRDDLRPFVETWFLRMRQCGADVRELMHDSCPTACVFDAAFGYVNAFKDRQRRFLLRRAIEGPGSPARGNGQARAACQALAGSCGRRRRAEPTRRRGVRRHAGASPSCGLSVGLTVETAPVCAARASRVPP
jgi:hypothetical protein